MAHKTHDSQQQEPASAAEAPQEVAEITQDNVEERIAALEAEVKAKEAEAAANYDKFVRERADLENYRKRVQREKEEILKYGNENFVLEVLPALDNLERAIEHASDESVTAILEGVKITLNMLLGALKKHGVTPLDSAPGTAFDPALHQAMAQVPTAEQAPNTVVQEYQKGYLINERLLRPAMVSVAIAPKEG